MTNLYDNESFFQAYSQMDRSRGGLSAAGEWHQLAPLFPELAGKRVLDLGCGYGWHCRYAAEQGAADVLGIDLSEKMIREARKRNPGDNITYRVCGIDAYEYPEETFDLAVSNLALHYIEDLDAVYRNVRKTLKPSGIFLFNMEHPVFTAGVREDWIYGDDETPLYWPVDNYYYPGEREHPFSGPYRQKAAPYPDADSHGTAPERLPAGSVGRSHALTRNARPAGHEGRNAPPHDASGKSSPAGIIP